MSFERWLKEIDKYSNQALIVHSVAVENIGVSIVRPPIYFLLERDARYSPVAENFNCVEPGNKCYKSLLCISLLFLYVGYPYW